MIWKFETFEWTWWWIWGSMLTIMIMSWLRDGLLKSFRRLHRKHRMLGWGCIGSSSWVSFLISC